MKTTFITKMLIPLIVLFFGLSVTFGQVPDTLVVSAKPPGNLNNVINGDTTATGESAHIYLLMPNGAVDTTYFITEEIMIKNLMLVGKTNPITGHPPVIAPYLRDDGSSPRNIAVAIDNGYVHFKNLYLLGTRLDGSQVTQQCISTSDSCRLTVENCIFENRLCNFQTLHNG